MTLAGLQRIVSKFSATRLFSPPSDASEQTPSLTRLNVCLNQRQLLNAIGLKDDCDPEASLHAYLIELRGMLDELYPDTAITVKLIDRFDDVTICGGGDAELVQGEVEHLKRLIFERGRFYVASGSTETSLIDD